MSEEVSEESPLDFILVVGGWDSSNTAHLLEIPIEKYGLAGYHVNTAKCVQPDALPLDRAVRIGVTSGASTPDSVVQECVE